MQRIVSIHIPNGYRFELNQQVIAEGEYTGGKFILLDDDDVTEHDNGMLALSFLNRKYNPDYYNQPVRQELSVPSTTIDRFKKHPALANVTKEVMFAKWK